MELTWLVCTGVGVFCSHFDHLHVPVFLRTLGLTCRDKPGLAWALENTFDGDPESDK